MNLLSLRRANVDRQAEWPGGEHADLDFRGLELAGETGELINLLKKKVRNDRGIKGTTEKGNELQIMLAEELADVVICLDLVCMELGVPIPYTDPIPDSVREIAKLCNLARCGNILNGRVGIINEEIAEELAAPLPDMTAIRISKALQMVGVIAELVEVNLDLAVPMKFNATSAKHGLKTRLL